MAGQFVHAAYKAALKEYHAAKEDYYRRGRPNDGPVYDRYIAAIERFTEAARAKDG
ncbi:hypothetical protein [Nocardia abscessus]|uniref:hypothetical protein n=1 Tax=Nocardia abscessus TaxID=120957 RepID=UPI002457FDF7|nr:hypothetical protein [Nocardia abscessus]